ncbi:linear amide C-N hydrolase [Fundidesulfovibrio agrisoli]|uniref:linear amide C-N hydrolase n=1 Tax=Fundidesulfovibrio agrisoli TaxID=2922717 RepID=UPI001FAB8189|nr:linear amide C-N hydrolase [Fundidesulfovibrio agrisoli]
MAYRADFRAALVAIVAFMALGVSFPGASHACSRVFWNNSGAAMVTARTMDWSHTFDDWLFVYPRGQRIRGDAGPKAATWTSKYGSVVCGIYGFASQLGFDESEGGTDGLNEKGLAAHLLYLETTKYAAPGGKPGVNYMRWLRYILDNFATVAEAVEGMKKVDIVSVNLGSEVLGGHMAIEDPSGDSAVFEIIDGKLKVHHGAQYTVMTNDPPYDEQLANAKQFIGLGGEKDLPGDTESANRFVRAAYYLQYLPAPADSEQAVGLVMSVARNVAVPFGAPYRGRTGEGVYPTWWLSATDVKNRIFYFSWVQNPNVIWVDLSRIDFSAGGQTRKLNPRNPALAGDVTRSFEPAR